MRGQYLRRAGTVPAPGWHGRGQDHVRSGSRSRPARVVAVVPLDEIALTTIDGRTTTFAEYAGPVTLVVNVASRCGFTRQYAALEALHRTYGARGLTVMGFPTHQFLQEPGSDEDIQQFCSTTFGVTFPLFAKTKVKGRDRHPLFAELTKARDTVGLAGSVRWNFEKFLVTSDGAVHRFRSTTEPDDPAVVALIEQSLAAAD